MNEEDGRWPRDPRYLLSIGTASFLLLLLCFYWRDRRDSTSRARLTPLAARDIGESRPQIPGGHTESKTVAANGEITGISGVVLDTCRLPVLGVGVRELHSGVQAGCTVRGTFELAFSRPLKSAAVHVRGPLSGLSSLPKSIETQDEAERLELIVATAPLSGIVLEQQTGRPVPGAGVRLFPHVGSTWFVDETVKDVRWPLTTSSDASGSFHFPAVPCRLEGVPDFASSLPYSIAVESRGHRQAWKRIRVEAGNANTQTLMISRHRLVCIAGIVLDERGRPLEGASVTVQARRWKNENEHGMMEGEAVPTQPDGTFEIWEEIWTDAGGDGYARVVIVSAKGYSRSDISLGADPDRFGGPHRIEMKPGLTISGRVLDQNGKGIPGARVRFDPVGGSAYDDAPLVKTDPDGRFACSALRDVAYDVGAGIPLEFHERWQTSEQWKRGIWPPSDGVVFTFVRLDRDDD